MAVATWIIFCWLLACVAIQALPGVVYLRALRQQLKATPDRSWQPRATVILCLRGKDPFLRDCLTALTSLRYRDYRVLCVLDSEADPAWQVLHEFTGHDRLATTIAPRSAGYCSLKCHSLVHAMDQLDDETEVVALVDADAVVDEHWLSDLVAPLREESVVASSGNRWYIPREHNPGTMVRFLWHTAAAFFTMHVLRIPWGGSLAIRVEFVRAGGLAENWSRALFEDTLIVKLARQRRGQIAFNPSLLVANGERISLTQAARWISRQLLNIRLYHRSFGLIVLHCVSTCLAVVAAWFLIIWWVVTGRWWLVLIVLAALVVFYGFYMIALHLAQSSARRALLQRNRQLPPPVRIGVRTLWSIMVTQMVYLLCLLHAMFCRSILWRGIRYRIAGPFEIQMGKYKPMSETQADDSGARSIED